MCLSLCCTIFLACWCTSYTVTLVACLRHYNSSVINEIKQNKLFWQATWLRFSNIAAFKCHEMSCQTYVQNCFLYRVLDHDTYSSHDAIGKLYIDLDPLLNKGNASMISGWFPIYDTMHGNFQLSNVPFVLVKEQNFLFSYKRPLL